MPPPTPLETTGVPSRASSTRAAHFVRLGDSRTHNASGSAKLWAARSRTGTYHEPKGHPKIGTKTRPNLINKNSAFAKLALIFSRLCLFYSKVFQAH